MFPQLGRYNIRAIEVNDDRCSPVVFPLSRRLKNRSRSTASSEARQTVRRNETPVFGYEVGEFSVCTSVHRWSVLITVQRDATQSSLFIILQVHCTCFGCQQHPPSGVHKTVTTAFGTGHIFCAATSLQRDQAWPRWREVAAKYRRL